MRMRSVVIALTLMAVGTVLASVGMKSLGWDISTLSTVELETNTYEVNEVFHNITVEAETANIVLAVSQENVCKVVCHEAEKVKHRVEAAEDTLKVTVEDRREWYEYIGINLARQKVTIYLPQAAYEQLSLKSFTGNVEVPDAFSFENAQVSVSTGHIRWGASVQETLKLKTSTGTVYAEGFSAQDVSVKVSTGETFLTDIACQTLLSEGSTGDISLKNAVAEELLSVQRSTGNVKLDRCDGGRICIETDTGDIRGSLLTEKEFSAHSDTGRVKVPRSVTGEACEISTDTGDINITIAE